MKRTVVNTLLKTVAALGMAVFLTACGGSDLGEIIEERREASFEEKVVTWLTDLQAYQATASVTYVSNKNVNHYDISHTVTRAGSYLIEVIGPERLAGNVTVSNGQHIFQVHRGLGHKFELGTVYERETKERTSLLLTNFADAFLDSPQAIDKQPDTGHHVLGVDVDSQHRYIARLVLVIDGAFNPLSLTSYDCDGEARIVVSYSSFVANPEIDVSVFDIQSMEELASTTDESSQDS